MATPWNYGLLGDNIQYGFILCIVYSVFYAGRVWFVNPRVQANADS